MTAQVEDISQVRTFLTSVVAVEQVNSNLRRITLRGGDLATFEPAGPDTFLCLLLPPPGRRDLTVDQSFTWERYDAMPAGEQPVCANYTLRAWRPERQEIELLVVLHGESGQASRWAARARPGDEVALWGPRTAYHPPPGSDRLLLVADETGLPAVAVILEQLLPGMRAQVIAEVACREERQELRSSPDVEVRWLYRQGAAPGTTTALVDAVRELPYPEGGPYVWGGGESRAMTQVRRHVRDVWRLDASAVSLVAYWRRVDCEA